MLGKKTLCKKVIYTCAKHAQWKKMFIEYAHSKGCVGTAQYTSIPIYLRLYNVFVEKCVIHTESPIIGLHLHISYSRHWCIRWWEAARRIHYWALFTSRNRQQPPTALADSKIKKYRLRKTLNLYDIHNLLPTFIFVSCLVTFAYFWMGGYKKDIFV